MRKTFWALAIAGAAAATSFAAPAGATTYVESRPLSRHIACFDRVYVPARVLVNTRGRQVRAPGTAWEIAGNSWNHVRTLGVYIQTERVIEQDHHTLRRRPC